MVVLLRFQAAKQGFLFGEKRKGDYVLFTGVYFTIT